jgi:hypothetical protein
VVAAQLSTFPMRCYPYWGPQGGSAVGKDDHKNHLSNVCAVSKAIA